MTYNADFWVASATAAPVIALAAVVVFREPFSTMIELVQLGHDPPRLGHVFSDDSPAGRAFSRAAVSIGLALYNCLAQTITLTLALISLASRDNAAPFAFVIAIECAGILALFAGAGAGVVASLRTKYTVDSDRPPEATEKPLAT